jgi:hypothetical protein
LLQSYSLPQRIAISGYLLREPDSDCESSAAMSTAWLRVQQPCCPSFGENVMRLYDAAGFLAASLVITAFWMKDIIALRCIALASNIAFLIYGAGLGLLPVWALHAALLPINASRLYQALWCDRCGQRAVQAGAMRQ